MTEEKTASTTPVHHPVKRVVHHAEADSCRSKTHHNSEQEPGDPAFKYVKKDQEIRDQVSAEHKYRFKVQVEIAMLANLVFLKIAIYSLF